MLSIGTRGKPRTLQVPGENLPKIFSLLEDPDVWAGRTVLVVSHVTPIKATVRRALGASADIYRTLHLDLASLSVVEFYPDGRSVVRLVNDTHYLR